MSEAVEQQDDVPEVDLQQVLREIDQEVRARRAAGDFPPGLERDLDAIFSRYAPAAATGDDLTGLLEAAERASFIDPDPPTGSRLPAVGLLKKGERKLLGWYFRYLANQVTSLSATLVKAMDVVGRRVAALEAASAAAHPAVALASAQVARPPTGGPAVDAAVATARSAAGRVLVADAGDGEVLARLVAEGVDAYGIDADPDRAATTEATGLDVRHADAVEHLRDVTPEAVAGVVLLGCTERRPVGALVDLADAVTGVLGPGGRVAVVARHPATWGRDNPVEADLSPGRPLHPETWVHLLTDRGFGDVTVTGDGDVYAVLATR